MHLYFVRQRVADRTPRVEQRVDTHGLSAVHVTRAQLANVVRRPTGEDGTRG